MIRTREEHLAADLFARDVTEHVMRVLLDQGLHRHLTFRRPHRAFDSWFDLITAPGSLTITGCRGNWTFRRDLDMFAFFRAANYEISPSYYAEKLGPGRDPRTYSKDMLLQNLIDPIDEWQADDDERNEQYLEELATYEEELAAWEQGKLVNGVQYVRPPIEPDKPTQSADLRQLIKGYDEDGRLEYEDGARGLLFDLENLGVVSETQEWRLSDYPLDYLWSLHAIAWGIKQYDQAVAAGSHKRRAPLVPWDQPHPTTAPARPDGPWVAERDVLTPHPAGGLRYDRKGRRINAKTIQTVNTGGLL